MSYLILITLIRLLRTRLWLLKYKYCFIFQVKMPRGSTTTSCKSCNAVIPVAAKICKSCEAVQPKRQRLAKKLQKFQDKKEDWLKKQKKNRTTSHVLDEASILVCVACLCLIHACDISV